MCVCVCVFVCVYSSLFILIWQLYTKLKQKIYIYMYEVEQLIDALRYKPKGRGFDSRQGHWNISLT